MAQALLFIPDISGYTQFVTSTEISHQQHIITELLDILLDSNDLGLELAEVEGDALFYYKVDAQISSADLMSMIKRMFLRFHSHLRYYDKYRICHCGACEGATGLTLKFVIHYGEIGFIQLKGQKAKPHGREVILVHRLLKNKVASREYVLATSVADILSGDEVTTALEGTPIIHDRIDYGEQDVGLVEYQYADLQTLRKYISEPRALRPGFKERNPLVQSREINIPPIELFELLINFEHRVKWNKGIDLLQYDKKEINKSGTRHLCVISGKEVYIDTVKTDSAPGVWSFGEKTRVPLVDELFLYYIITPVGKKSHLTIEAHPYPKKRLGKWMVPIFKYRFKSVLNDVLNGIHSYAEAYYSNAGNQ
jgi:hypothetical protein